MKYFFIKLQENKFKYLLILSLFIVFILSTALNSSKNDIKIDDSNLSKSLEIFVMDGCPHCSKAKSFLSNIEGNYDIDFVYKNVKHQENINLLLQYKATLPITDQLGTPIMVYNKQYIMGFDRDDTTGVQIEEMLNNSIVNQEEKSSEGNINVPFFGEIDLLNTSIPILAVVLGIADGFNPCAMWVLLYLISIASGLKDKKKIWFLISTFVVSSGILYFMFMTFWLNVFYYLGYLKILSNAVGIFAIYFGVSTLYDCIKNKGESVCKIEGNETRKKSMEKLKKFTQSDLTITTLLGIIGLAFVVNSIEFLCSAAIPQAFTMVLSKSALSVFMHYFYIFVYTLFFMIDDIIVFALAIFAINKFKGNKYGKYSSYIGGGIMVLIGVIITFFPNLLR